MFSVSRFLVAAASFYPHYAECTRYSSYDLPSLMLASPNVEPNFFAAVVVQGLSPKISIFLSFVGQTLLPWKISALQRRNTAFFLSGLVTTTRLDFAVAASFCLFLLLLFHCSEIGLCYSY